MAARDRDEEVRRSVAVIAARLDARLAEVTLDLRELLAASIPELDGDTGTVELLGASIEGNVAAIAQMLTRDIPVQRLVVPAAATEYARRLAERGVSVNALARAYRVGHDRLLSWALQEIGTVTADRELAVLVTRRLVGATFGYVDRIGEQVVLAYEQEHERWLTIAARSARCASRSWSRAGTATSTRRRPRWATRCGGAPRARRLDRRPPAVRDRALRAGRGRAARLPGPPAGQLVRPVDRMGVATGARSGRPGGGGGCGAGGARRGVAPGPGGLR